MNLSRLFRLRTPPPPDPAVAARVRAWRAFADDACDRTNRRLWRRLSAAGLPPLRARLYHVDRRDLDPAVCRLVYGDTGLPASYAEALCAVSYAKWPDDVREAVVAWLAGREGELFGEATGQRSE